MTDIKRCDECKKILDKPSDTYYNNIIRKQVIGNPDATTTMEFDLCEQMLW